MDEAVDHRRYVRDLAALSTLGAIWSRSEPQAVADGLSLVLLRSLPLECVHVRVLGADVSAMDALATAKGLIPSEQARAFGAQLEPLWRATPPGEPTHIAHPAGHGLLQLVFVPIGWNGDCGFLAAGSATEGFPSQADRLLLGVAANQAAVVLQHERLEAELRQSERELADFFDNALLGLHWIGPDGTILRANRAELAMLGYSADEYVGRPIADFHVDRDRIADILRRLHAGESIEEHEAEMRCKDGSIKHVHVTANVRWEHGRFLHTRCITRDVTERRRAQLTNALLGAIVDSSDDAIVSKNLDGIITSWNQGAERLFGYTAEEVVGRSVMLLFPPEREPEEREILGRLRRGERVDHFETVRVRKDGQRVDVSLTVSPIKDGDGRIVGASKIARDITGRRAAEAALRKQSEHLRLLGEAAAVLLSADDPDSMLRTLLSKIGPHVGSDVFLNYLVTERGDALRLASCEGIHREAAGLPVQLPFGASICGKVAMERRPIVTSHIQQSSDADTQLLRSIGLRAYACIPLVSEERLIGTLAFGSRTREAFEADDLTFLETICQYVTSALERLRLLRELQEGDRRKDDFLATLAHELRNPLAPVRNAVQVLRLKGPDEPELRWGRDVIDRQVRHLSRLIDDLLDIARITRNKLELRKERVALGDVVSAAVESCRPVITQHRHELTVELPPEALVLEGDGVRLTQVFLNLLNNAAKYTPDGGQIWVTVRRDGEFVEVTVKDTGVGMAPEHLSRLFEMFFQVPRPQEHARSGLGIGLSIVRRLVELHGGRVEARSEGEGRGCEFVVTLPLLDGAPSETSRGDSARAERPAVRRRILVVDDNRDAADTLATLLRIAGNEVRTAYDGLEGVATAAEFQPEAVLLDIGMPRLNGHEVGRRIRSAPWGRGMLLVAVTGWGQDADRRVTTEIGFDGHLVKPVDPAAVQALLSELAARGREAAEFPVEA